MRRAFAARAFASLLLALVAVPATAAGFRDFNSRHYRIYTDIDPLLADDLDRRMDQMYDHYAARLRQFVSGKGAMPRFEVRLYAKQADYLAYAGPQFKNTGGVFMAGKRVVAAFLAGQR